MNTTVKAAFSRLITAVSRLTDKVASKANATHTHSIADVTGLQNALDTKADASLLQAEQSAREAMDTALQGNIDAVHNLVNMDETNISNLEVKIANRG